MQWTSSPHLSVCRGCQHKKAHDTCWCCVFHSADKTESGKHGARDQHASQVPVQQHTLVPALTSGNTCQQKRKRKSEQRDKENASHSKHLLQEEHSQQVLASKAECHQPAAMPSHHQQEHQQRDLRVSLLCQPSQSQAHKPQSAHDLKQEQTTPANVTTEVPFWISKPVFWLPGPFVGSNPGTQQYMQHYLEALSHCDAMLYDKATPTSQPDMMLALQRQDQLQKQLAMEAAAFTTLHAQSCETASGTQQSG